MTMIEVNLLPEELRKKKKKKSDGLPKQRVLVLGVVAVLVLQVLASFVAFYQKSSIEGLKREVKKLTVTNSAILAEKTETAALGYRIKEADGLAKREFSWARLLNALSDSMTRGVWLNSFTIFSETPQVASTRTARAPKTSKASPAKAKDKNAKVEPKKAAEPAPQLPTIIYYLKIQGSAVGQGEETAVIGKFIQALKENPVITEIFDDIRLDTINQKKIRDTDAYDFTLLFTFKKGKLL